MLYALIVGERNKETGLASKKTIETVKGAERLIEALDVYNEETRVIEEYESQCKYAEAHGIEPPIRPPVNPLLNMYNTNCPRRFLLETLRRIKTAELEETLLTLPYNYVIDAFKALTLLLDNNWEVELVTKCACFLLK